MNCPNGRDFPEFGSASSLDNSTIELLGEEQGMVARIERLPAAGSAS
jgi:hypothetical protein